MLSGAVATTLSVVGFYAGGSLAAAAVFADSYAVMNESIKATENHDYMEFGSTSNANVVKNGKKKFKSVTNRMKIVDWGFNIITSIPQSDINLKIFYII